MDEDEMKSVCNDIVKSIVGEELVDRWWDSRNRAFLERTPKQMWKEDPTHVYEYLLNMASK